MTLTINSHISTVISNADKVKSEIAYSTFEIDGVEFKSPKEKAFEISDIAYTSLVGGASNMVMADFIRSATKQQVIDYAKTLVDTAKLAGVSNAVLEKAFSDFFLTVKVTRSRLASKDKMFLGCESKDESLQRVKGKFQVTFGAWRDDCWWKKAIIAAQTVSNDDDDTSESSDSEQGSSEQQGSKINGILASLNFLSLEDLEAVISKATQLKQEKSEKMA